MAMMEVRYVGTSAYRVLTAADLKQHGIESVKVKRRPSAWERSYVAQGGVNVDMDESLLWGPQNGQSIVLDVTPELEKFLRAQGHFTILSLDDDGRVKETVAEPTPEQAQAVTGVVVYEQEGKPTQRVEQSGEQPDLNE